MKKVTHLWIKVKKKSQISKKNHKSEKKVTESHKLVTKSCKLVKKSDKLLSGISEKNHKLVKKWHKIVISMIITKNTYLDQDAGDSLDTTTTIALKFIYLRHNLFILHMKLVIEFVGVDGLEHLWAECNRQICLDARACGLAEVHV